MDRIAYERLLSEINSTTGVAPIDERLSKGDTP
jgi:hypothetical protein